MLDRLESNLWSNKICTNHWLRKNIFTGECQIAYKSLKINKLRIKDKLVEVVDQKIEQFLAEEKEKQYKKMLHSMNREKRRKKIERATKKRKIQAYAERLDKAALSG